ncbi:lipopolysaccharide biosynthesis protein [Lichenihabitans sp. Uapishka_5]|uniref:lipopolysaccharide biosynthesis protein n=1 Tax=Lichenihabitans sp. Uapishka_5 TaxID=3037302 RepID=UPI0029E823CD|nr:lipopolysaccharide biosynthesis protein [Lichenihabitans sp. Uapishka_5]MDX7950393.1 lipopolysaccharide biosynthesis protein [Lichenihabitans sp. Uapishka_5]
MSRFLRNSVFGTLAGLSTTLGNFLSGLVVSRLLGVEPAGSVAFAVWAVWLGTTVVNGGLPFTLARYLPEVGARDGDAVAQQLAARLLRPFAAVAVLPALGGLGYAAWLIHGQVGDATSPFRDPVICALIGANITTQALGDFARSVLRGRHAFDAVARTTATMATLQIVALLVGAGLFGTRGAVAAYWLASWVPLVVLREVWGPTGPPQRAVLGRMRRYARFRWASDILGFLVWSRIEILFLQLAWGLGSVGLFSAGMTLANLAVQGPLMLTWALMPRFAELHGQHDRDSMLRLYATGTRLLAFLVFPASFGLAAVLPSLLPLLYGQAFAGAIPAAQVLVCAASLAAISSVGSNLVWGLERSDADFYASLAGAALALVGGVVLIRPFGDMGAAASRALTQACAVGISSWFLWARLGFAIPVGALLRLFGAALLCGGVARGVLALHPGVLGLAVAIPSGAITYVAAVRLFGALTADDTARLHGLVAALPWPIARRADPWARLILG